MKGASYYKLECHTCSHTIELPARDGRTRCPNCGVILLIEWSGARADFDRLGQRTLT
jgi:DNA-directed RNA polymerase subunit RPC12/RpoP